MKHDVTPEEKTGAEENSPPAKHSLSLPKDSARCAGCLYPGVTALSAGVLTVPA